MIDEENKNHVNESTKYKFAKIVEIEGTEIKVLYTNTPDGYKEKGYNEDLNIDTSKLRDTKEEETINLIGVTTNIYPKDIGEVRYVRIGTYEPEKNSGEFNLRPGAVVSVDEIK